MCLSVSLLSLGPLQSRAARTVRTASRLRESVAIKHPGGSEYPRDVRLGVFRSVTHARVESYVKKSGP